MVAGIFAKHGVWSGQPMVNIQWEGEPCYENEQIKRYVIRRYGRLECGPEIEQCADDGSEIMAMIRAEGYESGPWFFKVSAMYWRAFEPLEPLIVTIRRPVASIKKSVARDNLRVDVDYHERVLDYLEADGALRIDSPRLVEGDLGQIRDVFEKLGLVFDPEIVMRFVKPRLWHS